MSAGTGQFVRWFRRRGLAARLVLGQATARWRRLPGAVILGAQKAGTSTFLASLGKHRAIGPSCRKEVRFFDLNHGRGERFYRAFFPLGVSAGRVAMEASPDYLPHPGVPRRMVEILPEVRLIVLLRDPVSRAYSHYQHTLRRGHEPLGFEAAIEAEADRLREPLDRIASDPTASLAEFHRYSYLLRGRYAEQLERFLEVYPRDRLLALKAEDYFAAPREALARTLRFLDLPDDLPVPPVRKRRIGEYEPMAQATRDRLRAYFAPHNRRLAGLLGEPFDWGY